MTLNDFMELCEKNHIQAEEYSKNWYIANIKSKFINATWIICYCTTDEKTVLPKDISTDGNTITYNGNVLYNETDFKCKLEIVRELVRLCKQKEVENKLENLKSDF